MICPHCAQNVLRRERTGRRCGKCRQAFALEPKETVLGLHDMRVRRLADKLGGGRGLRYTLPQLYYAAARRKVPDLRVRFLGRRFLVSVPIAVVTFFTAISGVIPPAITLVVGAGALILVNLGMTAIKPWFLRTSPVRLPVTYDRFVQDTFNRWISVYGAPPHGSVADFVTPPPVPEFPRVALLCEDRSVWACLAANGAVENWQMVFANRVDRLPPRVPVLILHDASVAGLLFAGAALAALGPRGVPVGIAPRSLLGKPKALRLRDAQPSKADLDRVRPLVSPQEFEWLAQGWFSPVSAVPPAKLIAAVDGALNRAEDATDPDRRAARAIGFLTWPAA